jgi:PAS domain S-box-containing protein
MQFLPAGPARQDEVGIFQNLEMLHYTKARHGQPGLQVFQRAAVALKEQVQEDATRSVSKCLEYLVVVRHHSTIGDHMVTCQVAPACPRIARDLPSAGGRLFRRGGEEFHDHSKRRLYLVDADFRIREVNPTAAKVLGFIANLIGRDFAEVIAILWLMDYAEDLVRVFRHTLETGEPFFMPERVERRRDSGMVEVYEWQVHRIQQPDGRFGVVCYFRDISNQVSARERLTLLVNELNHRVKNTLARLLPMPATAANIG